MPETSQVMAGYKPTGPDYAKLRDDGAGWTAQQTAMQSQQSAPLPPFAPPPPPPHPHAVEGGFSCDISPYSGCPRSPASVNRDKTQEPWAPSGGADIVVGIIVAIPICLMAVAFAIVIGWAMVCGLFGRR